MSVHSELMRAVKEAYRNAKDNDAHHDIEDMDDEQWTKDLQEYCDEIQVILHDALLDAVRAVRQEQKRKKSYREAP